MSPCASIWRQAESQSGHVHNAKFSADLLHVNRFGFSAEGVVRACLLQVLPMMLSNVLRINIFVQMGREGCGLLHETAAMCRHCQDCCGSQGCDHMLGLSGEDGGKALWTNGPTGRIDWGPREMQSGVCLPPLELSPLGILWLKHQM